MQTSCPRPTALPRHFGRHRPQWRAFTLVELLVTVGIVGALLALLMPSINAAQRKARELRCQANLRTLSQGLLAYATSNGGRFPPNRSLPAPALSWADPARLGGYIMLPPPGPAEGSAYVCPDDRRGARRSYAMNAWASSRVDRFILRQRPPRGRLWRLGAARSSQMVLLIEAWSAYGTASTGFRSMDAVGITGTPGQRFGGGGGLRPFNAGRFGRVNCELDYTRHRQGKGAGVQPIGRLAIAFGDGHVELRSNESLVEFTSGALTGDCFWSPLDEPR